MLVLANVTSVLLPTESLTVSVPPSLAVSPCADIVKCAVGPTNCCGFTVSVNIFEVVCCGLPLS
jgi:hypothetical protein